MKSKRWEEISFILRSPLSRRILECLISSERPLTVVEISKLTNIARSNISTKFIELKKRKLVECKNPESKKFRFYEITKKGKEIMKEVEKVKK